MGEIKTQTAPSLVELESDQLHSAEEANATVEAGEEDTKESTVSSEIAIGQPAKSYKEILSELETKRELGLTRRPLGYAEEELEIYDNEEELEETEEVHKSAQKLSVVEARVKKVGKRVGIKNTEVLVAAATQIESQWLDSDYSTVYSFVRGRIDEESATRHLGKKHSSKQGSARATSVRNIPLPVPGFEISLVKGSVIDYVPHKLKKKDLEVIGPLIDHPEMTPELITGLIRSDAVNGYDKNAVSEIAGALSRGVEPRLLLAVLELNYRTSFSDSESDLKKKIAFAEKLLPQGERDEEKIQEVMESLAVASRLLKETASEIGPDGIDDLLTIARRDDLSRTLILIKDQCFLRDYTLLSTVLELDRRGLITKLDAIDKIYGRVFRIGNDDPVTELSSDGYKFINWPETFAKAFSEDPVLVQIFESPEATESLLALTDMTGPLGHSELSDAFSMAYFQENKETLIPLVKKLTDLGLDFGRSFGVLNELKVGLLERPDLVGDVLSGSLDQVLTDVTRGVNWIPDIGHFFRGYTFLTELCQDEEARQDFYEAGGVDFLKFLLDRGIDPDSAHSLEVITDLARDPNSKDLVTELYNMGVDFSLIDIDGMPPEEALKIIRTPGASEALLLIVRDYGKNYNSAYQVLKTVESLLGRPDLAEKLRDKTNIKFIKDLQLSIVGNVNENIEPLLSLDERTRDDLIALRRIYQIHLHIEPNLTKELEKLGGVLADEALRERLLSEEAQENYKRLQQSISFEPSFDILPIIARLDNDFCSFVEGITTNRGWISAEQIMLLSRLYDEKDQVNRIVSVLGSYDVINPTDALTIIFNQGTRLLEADVEKMGEFLHLIKEASLPVPSVRDLLSLMEQANGSVQAADLIQKVAVIGRVFDGIGEYGYLRAYDEFTTKLAFKLAESGVSDADFESGIKFVKTTPISGIAIQEAYTLFLSLGSSKEVYQKLSALLGDGYYARIRDAEVRQYEFIKMLRRGLIPSDILRIPLSWDIKASDFDRISYKLTQLASMDSISGVDIWGMVRGGLVADNQNAFSDSIEKARVDLTLDLLREKTGMEVTAEQRERIEKDEYLSQVLEIASQAVSTFSGHQDADRLFGFIYEALVDNLSVGGDAYTRLRVDKSSHLFDNIFENIPACRERVMTAWTDLSTKGMVRVNPMSREVDLSETQLALRQISDIFDREFLPHLKDLVRAKASFLVESNDVENSKTKDQLELFNKFFRFFEGDDPKDFIAVYKELQKYIKNTKKSLALDSESQRALGISEEQKKSMGRTLGLYVALTELLVAVHRVKSVDDKHLKKVDFNTEYDKSMRTLASILKKLGIVDKEKPSKNQELRLYEEEVLADLTRMLTATDQQDLDEQTTLITESTDSFVDIANAPLLTGSCQRLTEETAYNNAAFARILDGVDQMIEISSVNGKERQAIARAHIELSKAMVDGREVPVVFVEHMYIDPQLDGLRSICLREIVSHLEERFKDVPDLLVTLDGSGYYSGYSDVLSHSATKEMSYFINQSRTGYRRYYDSAGGLRDVSIGVFDPEKPRFVMV